MLAPEYAFGVSCVFFIGGYLLGTIHASGYMETTAISEAWWRLSLSWRPFAIGQTIRFPEEPNIAPPTLCRVVDVSVPRCQDAHAGPVLTLDVWEGESRHQAQVNAREFRRCIRVSRAAPPRKLCAYIAKS